MNRNSWVFFVALFSGLAIMSWQLKQKVDFRRTNPVGDGKDLASYGYDLSTCLIPQVDLYPAGVPRDGLPSLDFPRHLDAAGLDSLNEIGRSPFILPRDLVIGVAAGGQARAYPLSILNWHEVVNDTIGGVPVLVTWSPLTGSAKVYARGVGEGTPEFGVSGLLYNSNTLLYDRTENSVWSQIQGRALVGPAAARAETLQLHPFELIRWDVWLARHPASLILAPETEHLFRNYRKQPYTSYLGSDRLQFPVRDLPDRERMSLKTIVLGIVANGEWRLYPFPSLKEDSGPGGVLRVEQGGRLLEIIYRDDPPTASVRAADGGPAPVWSQAYWFAWYSQYPEHARNLLLTDDR